MRERLFRISLSAAIFVFVARPPCVAAGTLTGMVIGDGARPVAGALVQVVGSAQPCETRSGADGTFTLACDAAGVHVVRASFGDLRPWEVADVELAADREVYLNFVLLPAGVASVGDNAAAGAGGAATAGDRAASAAATATAAAAVAPEETGGFWTRPVPNPVLANWGDRSITLRALAIVVAVLSFPLGALTMLLLGRRFGIDTSKLSSAEVGDMLLNPSMPKVGERVTPVATAGARGASANVSYGADEIAAALSEGRYGLVFAALVVAPGLFAAFGLALGMAMLIGHETYLLALLSLVSAGFVITPVIIGVQALARRPKTMTPV